MAKTKEYHYFYFDERNDDFANNGIDGKPTPPDYEYYPSNILYRIFKPIVYYFVTVCLVTPACLLIKSLRAHNRKVLRNRDRKKGCFIFGNHTTWMADAIVGPATCLPKQVYTVVNPDAISIKGASTIIRMVGAMPNPSSRRTYVRFIEAMKRMYENGNPVVIYPEAHIWPKYNGIRDFDDVSFHIPAMLGAPCFAKSTVYHADSKGHTRCSIWYDGPFYADKSLPLKEAQKDLRNRIHKAMTDRCKDSQLDCRYHYCKVDSSEKVRTEVVRR